jgi:hypothetical protein
MMSYIQEETCARIKQPYGFSANAWRWGAQDGESRLALMADAMLWQNILISDDPVCQSHHPLSRRRAMQAFSAVPGLVDC